MMQPMQPMKLMRLTSVMQFATSRLTGWRPWQYAAISVCGLVGMLALEGWLHSVMLGLSAWPAVVGWCAWRGARVNSNAAAPHR